MQLKLTFLDYQKGKPETFSSVGSFFFVLLLYLQTYNLSKSTLQFISLTTLHLVSIVFFPQEQCDYTTTARLPKQQSIPQESCAIESYTLEAVTAANDIDAIVVVAIIYK